MALSQDISLRNENSERVQDLADSARCEEGRRRTFRRKKTIGTRSRSRGQPLRKIEKRDAASDFSDDDGDDEERNLFGWMAGRH